MENNKLHSNAEMREDLRKANFVDKYLKPLILNADLYAEDVFYRKVGGCETVTVRYKNGGEVVSNVSCDSLVALCRDTLKNL